MSRVTPVQQSTELTKIAQKRADYLCKTDTFSHKGWGKYESKYSYRGENLYKGNESIKEINDRFIASPIHKDVITNSAYQYVGIATKCDILVEEFGGLSN